MTTTLGVLNLDDLVPGRGTSDADRPPPRPTGTDGQWTVRVDDAAAISVSGLPGVTPGSDELPVDDHVVTEERDELPVVSDDVGRAATSTKTGSNWTRVDIGPYLLMLFQN